MEKYIVYHNPRCSKSRCALKYLEDRKIPFEIKEYLLNVPTKVEIKKLLSLLKIPADQLVRKGETIYKENFKGKKLSESDWIEAMVKYPKLIERPIVVNGDKAIIGRPTELIDSLI